MTQQPKVLIFDSGVGGLSVYKEIVACLPQLDYYYLFDNAAYPYGELERQTLLERVNKLVSAMVEKHQIDLVVIACNTASTIVLPSLRKLLTIPVVGVVPAIKPASVLASKAVGLIATPATVKREYTHELIRNFSQNKTVEMLGSTRLVDIAEEKLRGQRVSLEEVAELLAPLANKIDVAVLGCTHFPLLKEEIQTVLGSQVMLVDSGEAIARRIKGLLALNLNDERCGVREIYSSAPPWQEDALNHSLIELGFNPVRLFHLEI